MHLCKYIALTTSSRSIRADEHLYLNMHNCLKKRVGAGYVLALSSLSLFT